MRTELNWFISDCQKDQRKKPTKSNQTSQTNWLTIIIIFSKRWWLYQSMKTCEWIRFKPLIYSFIHSNENWTEIGLLINFKQTHTHTTHSLGRRQHTNQQQKKKRKSLNIDSKNIMFCSEQENKLSKEQRNWFYSFILNLFWFGSS